MGEAAVAPKTQMALRTPAPPAPERMLKRSPRGTRAPKPVKILRQWWMVLPEAAQGTVERPPTGGGDARTGGDLRETGGMSPTALLAVGTGLVLMGSTGLSAGGCRSGASRD